MNLTTSLLAQQSFWNIGTILAVVAIIAVLIFLAIALQFFGLWIQATFSRASIGLFDLLFMKLRKVDLRTVVLAKIQLVKAGIHDITTNDLESHFLAGGRVVNVSRAMIAANRAVIELDWKKSCAIDLAGRDIIDAVNTSVNPKVIDCPNPALGKSTIDAVAKDGIQLKAKARVTVRTNIR